MTQQQPILILDKITQDYSVAGGITNIVAETTIAFDRGINMLLGPSGCGKSTLLRLCGGVRPFGVQSPTSGRIWIDGKECYGQHDDAIMVFQQSSVRPDLSIRENIAFPFTLKLWRNKKRAEVEEAVDQMLSAVGLADKADLRPSQLSGGQNQRVSLARALVLRPRILLMDEPFGALDAQTREDMQNLLHRLITNNPCLVLFVTHDISEAIILGDRVTVLSTKPAKITEDFYISKTRPRERLWLESPEAQQLHERIWCKLQSAKK